jgi:predicted DNA-binding protein
MPSSTSSYRISDKLRRRVEKYASTSGKGKNTVLLEALEEYLERHEAESIREKARRQSLAASHLDRVLPDFTEAMDTDQWK